MKITAAVLRELGKPLTIEEIDTPDLQPGQVLVDIAYSGVCHTQLLEARGKRGEDPYLPHLLGHEGSGTVRDIGADVTRVKPGDRVVLSWMKGEGGNVAGTMYTKGEERINSGAITTFSTQSVISENRLTVIPDDLDFKHAALLGCALPTGFGVIKNVACATKEHSVVIFGMGGIGMSVLLGSVTAGCQTIIGVDMVDEKLTLAQKLGATHVFNPKTQDVQKEILELCKGGVDFVIDATGVPAVMQGGLDLVKSQGGKVIVIGNAPKGSTFTVDPSQLNQGKSILGTWGGDNVPSRDFPVYIEQVKANTALFEPFVSKVYTLDQVNDALDDLESGKVLRPLIQL